MAGRKPTQPGNKVWPMVRRVLIQTELERAMAVAFDEGQGLGLGVVLDKHEGSLDIDQAITQARHNGYGICMCVAATGDVQLFKRVCELGADPFEENDPSGDTALSVALFYMNRHGEASHEPLLMHLLEIGAAKQETTYHLYNPLGVIWNSGVVSGKSARFLQAAISAGFDLNRCGGVDGQNARATPIEQLCQNPHWESVRCIDWLLNSENVRHQDLARAMQIKDGVPTGIDRFGPDEASFRILKKIGARLVAMQAVEEMSAGTDEPAGIERSQHKPPRI